MIKTVKEVLDYLDLVISAREEEYKTALDHKTKSLYSRSDRFRLRVKIRTLREIRDWIRSK